MAHYAIQSDAMSKSLVWICTKNTATYDGIYDMGAIKFKNRDECGMVVSDYDIDFKARRINKGHNLSNTCMSFRRGPNFLKACLTNFIFNF
jgi:hypothetical protein